MRNQVPMFVLGIALICGGCGKRDELRALPPDAVVVAFGDSLTAGVGAGRGESYPAVLAERIGHRVINAGASGEETSGGLQRLPRVLQEIRPDLVILCHGGNDMLRGRDAAVIHRNLDAMISRIRGTGAEVILIAVPTPGILLRVPDFYRALGDRHGIPVETKVLREVLRTPSLKSDRVHPNAAGYRKMADAVAALLD